MTQRRRFILGLVVLAVAVTATVRLLTLPVPAAQAPTSSASPGGNRLADVWPGITPSTRSGLLADGAEYTPGLYVDQDTSVGIAETPDGKAVRLLLCSGDRVTELQRIPATEYPQYNGLVAAGDEILWALSSSPGEEPVKTGIWRANWRTGGKPQLITEETGEAVFAQSQYDLTVRDGRVAWASVEYVKEPVTIVHSVPLTGGKVTSRRVPGAYHLAKWPWLVSVASGKATAVRLKNLDTNVEVQVASSPAEVTVCGALWCRAVIVGQTTGPTRIDLMRPDGSERRRIAGADSGGVTADVALLDRFEPIGTVGTDSGSTLSVYDIATDRTVIVAEGVGTVRGGHGVIWWSAGDNETTTWYALDLRRIPAP